jgi:hypothetical protein
MAQGGSHGQRLRRPLSGVNPPRGANSPAGDRQLRANTSEARGQMLASKVEGHDDWRSGVVVVVLHECFT